MFVRVGAIFAQSFGIDEDPLCNQRRARMETSKNADPAELSHSSEQMIHHSSAVIKSTSPSIASSVISSEANTDRTRRYISPQSFFERGARYGRRANEIRSKMSNPMVGQCFLKIDS